MENELHLGLEGFKKLCNTKIVENKKLAMRKFSEDLEDELTKQLKQAIVNPKQNTPQIDLEKKLGVLQPLKRTTYYSNPSSIGQITHEFLDKIVTKKESYEIKQLLAETRNEIDELELKLLKLKDLCNILEAKEIL